MSRLAEVFQDTSNQLSSKRVAAFVALACFVGASAVSLVGPVMPEIFVTGFRDIILGGLVLSVPEHFATPRT